MIWSRRKKTSSTTSAKASFKNNDSRSSSNSAHKTKPKIKSTLHLWTTSSRTSRKWSTSKKITWSPSLKNSKKSRFWRKNKTCWRAKKRKTSNLWRNKPRTTCNKSPNSKSRSKTSPQLSLKTSRNKKTDSKTLYPATSRTSNKRTSNSFNKRKPANFKKNCKNFNNNMSHLENCSILRGLSSRGPKSSRNSCRRINATRSWRLLILSERTSWNRWWLSMRESSRKMRGRFRMRSRRCLWRRKSVPGRKSRWTQKSLIRNCKKTSVLSFWKILGWSWV